MAAQGNDAPLVEVRHLKEYFPVNTGFFKTTPLKAVDDVSFSIKRGETLGLVGESGCGKTTVGRTILHLYEPTDGVVVYDGKAVVGPKEKVDIDKFATPADGGSLKGNILSLNEYRTKTTMVFQDPYSSLNPRMTVSDIIAEPLDVHKMCANAQEREERVLELMNRVGLNSEHASRYAHEFSGGQRQRIGIARSLAVNPEFIVCDEPVSALDVSIQAQVINLLHELQQKMSLTYLFIAHDLNIVRYLSDRIAVMYLGSVVELADSAELYRNTLHPYSRALLSAVPVPDPDIEKTKPRQIIEGDVPSPINKPKGCAFSSRCPLATATCRESAPALKEVAPGHFCACHLVG